MAKKVLSSQGQVKCSRCKRSVPAEMAVGYWLVVTYVTPILRRVKKKMYCTQCQEFVA